MNTTKRALVCLLAAALLLVADLAMPLTPPSLAADQLVTNTNDNGAGSLRQAIADVSAGETITFNLTYPATIILTSGELVVNKDLTITGPGADQLTISGNDTSRVFNVSSGTVTISGLTIRDGYVTGDPAQGGGVYVASAAALTLQQVTVTDNLARGSDDPDTGGQAHGGGIYNAGTLDVLNSTISANTARGGDGGVGMGIGGDAYGGGLSKGNTPMTVMGTTLSGNSAQEGIGMIVDGQGHGGGYSPDFSGGTLAAIFVNCTFSGNSASWDGGGVFDHDGNYSYCTIANNQAEIGGGLCSDTNLFAGPAIDNTIIADNTAFTLGPDIYDNIASYGYNLIENTSGGNVGGDTTGNITDVDPNLAALANNGGSTWTHALNVGSQAIDAGSSTDVDTDQRGVARPQGQGCDVGAVENGLPVFTSAPQTAASEDVAYTYNVTADDPDLGDELIISAPVLPAWLNLADHDGTSATLFGRPAFGDVGDHAVTLQVTDSTEVTGTQTFTLTVAGDNDAPTLSALGDQATPEDVSRGPIPFTVGDQETPAGSLLVSATSSNPALVPEANIVLAGSGAERTVTLTPLADQSGSAAITLTVSDGSLAAQATFDLAVNPANDAPASIGLDDDTVAEGLPAGALVGNLSATDVDAGDSHTFALVPGAGSEDNSLFSVDANTLRTATVLDREAQGQHYIRLRATDAAGLSVEGTFAVVVANANDPPQVQPDLAETEFGTPVTVDVLANDGDPDGDPLYLLAVYCSQSCGGAAVVSGDEVVYTPAADSSGLETFSYIVHDGNAGMEATTLSVLVQPPDAEDVDLQPDVMTTTEEMPLSIPVLANDTAPEALDLIYAGPSAGGQTSLDEDGQVYFEPALDFSGVATFTYAALAGESGGGSALVTVHVLPINDAPYAAADSASTLQGTPVAIDLLANDGDPDGDAITLVDVAQGDHGLVLRAGPGQVTYTPQAGFHGTDTFTYVIVDGRGGAATGQVHVQVVEVNEPPVGVMDEVFAQEDTPTLIDVLANDTDPNAGDTLQVIAVSQPQSGTVRLLANGTVQYTPFANTSGPDNFGYTLQDSGGPSALPAVAAQVLTANGLVSLTVQAILDPPAANPTFESTDMDQPIAGLDVLGNATNADGQPLAIESYTEPASGTLTLNPDGTFDYTPTLGFEGQVSFEYTLAVSKTARVQSSAHAGLEAAVGQRSGKVTLQIGALSGNVVTSPGATGASGGTSLLLDPLANAYNGVGDLVLIGMQRRLGLLQANPNGTLTYTPPPNWSGTDVISYTVADQAGGVASGVIHVAVSAGNRPPDAVADMVSAQEDTPLAIDVKANDYDYEGGTLTVQAVGPAAHGQAVLEWDGTVTYTPPPDFHGIDHFAYVLADDQGASDVTLVTLVVANVNDPPLARDDMVSTMEDTRTIVGVLGNDTDPDGDIPQVTAGKPQHGTVQVTPVGTLNYLPPPDFHGTDVLSYTVSDGAPFEQMNGVAPARATAWVTIIVNQVNDPPVAVTDTTTITAGESISIGVLANDYDLDSSQLRLVSVEAPAGDQAAVQGKTVVYTPAEGPGRTVQFTYTVADEHGGRATGNVVVTLLGPPTRIFLPLVVKE